VWSDVSTGLRSRGLPCRSVDADERAVASRWTSNAFVIADLSEAGRVISRLALAGRRQRAKFTIPRPASRGPSVRSLIR